jgi:hypothetical protein
MATSTPNYGLRKPVTSDNVIVLTDVSDNMDDIDTALKDISDVANAVGVWAEYSPTWASVSNPQPVLGNGTLKARWAKAGKLVHVRLRLTIGATTTLGTGVWSFTLPLASISNSDLETFGQCVTLDAGTGYKHDVANVASGASTMRMIGIAPGSFYSPTVPQAWASTDFLNISLTYEAA